MSSGLEPFPLFIDSAPPESANYFSSTISSSMQALSPSPTPHMRKPRVSVPAKLSNYIRVRYYQYEVTFGLYMLTPSEKVVLNTIILTILSAILYTLYWGLESVITQMVCRVVYYVMGSAVATGELCAQ